MREPDWVVINRIQCQCDLCCLNFDKNVVKILKRVVGLVQGLLNKEIQFFHILFFPRKCYGYEFKENEVGSIVYMLLQICMD